MKFWLQFWMISFARPSLQSLRRSAKIQSLAPTSRLNAGGEVNNFNSRPRAEIGRANHRRCMLRLQMQLLSRRKHRCIGKGSQWNWALVRAFPRTAHSETIPVIPRIRTTPRYRGARPRADRQREKERLLRVSTVSAQRVYAIDETPRRLAARKPTGIKRFANRVPKL